MPETPSRSSDTGHADELANMDRCWGVPAAMAAGGFLICMPSTCFGLLFVLFMDRFGATREEAAWPENAFTLASHLSGFGIFALQRCMRIYHIILLSTILNSVALIAAAFSPNITCMSIMFGAIHGFGMGLFTTSAGIYILLYFYKYRATALSIFYGVGWAVAGIVGQLILSALVGTYGFQGGLFLLGGIMMHSIPIVMLAGNPSPMSIACKWRETDPAEIRKSGPDDLRSTNVINEGKAEGPQELRPICKPALPESCSVRHALALFVTPAFYVIVAVIIIDDYSNVQFSTTIVDYAIDKGIPLDTAKTLISFSSSGNLIGRVAVPFLADVRPRLRIPIYVLAFVLVTTVLIATTRVYAYEGVAALTLIHGISKGTLLCFRTVIIAEILGVDRSAACAGITGVTMIPLSLASPAILGSFRDGRGSYDGFYWMIAAINLAAAITFSIFAVLDRRRRIGTWTNDDCEKKN